MCNLPRWWAKVASYLVIEGCVLYVRIKELGLPASPYPTKEL